MGDWLVRAARRIQLEDVALVGAMLAGAVVDPAADATPVLEQAGALGPLVALLAAIGAIAALATRVPGESRFDMRGGEPNRMWMIGPFIGAIAFVTGDALERLGLPGGNALVGIAFVVAVATLLLGDRLPVVSRPVRRLMVAPFVLLSALFLQELAADALSGLSGVADVAAILAQPDGARLLLTFVGILGFVAGAFYMMLVFVPRELADPGASTLSWALRFALFFVSLLAAIWLGGRALIIV